MKRSHIPEDGRHLVFALDLALLAPTLVLAGHGDVPGVKAFPIEGIVLLLGFVVASAVLIIRKRHPDRAGDRSSR